MGAPPLQGETPRDGRVRLSGVFHAKRRIVKKLAAGMAREMITLACTECKRRNYTTMKEKRNTPGRLEKRKFCKFERKHTLHRETK